MLACAATEGAVVHFYEGEPLQAFTMTGVDGTHLRGTVGGTMVSVPLETVSAVEMVPKVKPLPRGPKEVAIAIHSVNGDVLIGVVQTMTEDAFVLQFHGQALTLAKRFIKGLRVVAGSVEDTALPPLSRTVEEETIKLAATSISAKLVGMTPSDFTFQTSAGKKTLAYWDEEGRLKLEAVYFPHPSVRASAITCRLKLADGGSLLQGQLKSGTDSTLLLKTAYADEVAVPLDRVVEMWLVGGRAWYLSDLVPIRVVEESPWGKPGDPWVLIWSYKNDRNCRNQPLALGGKTYRRGIGVHSKCELTYEVPEGYQTFEGLVGIDDRVAGKGESLVGFAVSDVTIKVDEREVFYKRLGGSQTVTAFKVPVQGAKTITLIADYGEKVKLKVNEKGEPAPDAQEREISVDFGDWVDFAEARFSK